MKGLQCENTLLWHYVKKSRRALQAFLKKSRVFWERLIELSGFALEDVA